MENIRFASKEHKAFYGEMLFKTHNDDAYHRAFFYAMGICEETRRNIRTLFDSKTAGLTRTVFRLPGRRAVLAAYAVWPLTFGTAGRRKEKKSIPPPMNCLTAVLRPTFLKPSGCVIPNIAATWSVSPLGFPINHANYQRSPKGGERIERNKN